MGRKERWVDKVEEKGREGERSVRGWTRWRNNNGAPALTVGVAELKGAVPGGLIIITLVQGMRSCVPHLTLPSPWLATAPVLRPTSDLLDITTGRVSEGERRRWWTIIFRTLTVGNYTNMHSRNFENSQVYQMSDFLSFLTYSHLLISFNDTLTERINYLWD